MPRKHHQKWSHIKPVAFPSSLPTLAASTAGSSSISSSAPTTSVNTLLSRLRNSRSHHHHDSDPNPSAVLPPVAPSVPPNLQYLLGTPLPPPPLPRPRITAAPRNRRTPGPPPPASWLAVPAPSASHTSVASLNGVSPRVYHSYLPHPPLPEASSLTHLTLKAIAREFDFHTTWDKYYLPLLPARMKSLLLLYLPGVITPARLLALFPAEDGEEDVLHLSLAHCSPATLVPIFRPPAASEGSELVESWDSAPPAATTRFPALTHLSLAHPGTEDAKGLLKLLELTPGLTHLSLDGWAEGAVMEKVLRGMVKKLLCLKWLEMDGCVVSVLEGEEAAWIGAWRGVETIVLVGAPEWKAKEFQSTVRAARKREGRGAWFEVLVG